jgi:hypothetical protein
MGENPQEFNQEPDAGSTGLIVGIAIQEVEHMQVNWKQVEDLAIHIGAQAAAAGGTAIVLSLSHADYSSLGALGPMIQMGAALLAESWNTAADWLKNK